MAVIVDVGGGDGIRFVPDDVQRSRSEGAVAGAERHRDVVLRAARRDGNVTDAVVIEIAGNRATGGDAPLRGERSRSAADQHAVVRIAAGDEIHLPVGVHVFRNERSKLVRDRRGAAVGKLARSVAEVHVDEERRVLRIGESDREVGVVVAIEVGDCHRAGSAGRPDALRERERAIAVSRHEENGRRRRMWDDEIDLTVTRHVADTWTTDSTGVRRDDRCREWTGAVVHEHDDVLRRIHDQQIAVTVAVDVGAQEVTDGLGSDRNGLRIPQDRSAEDGQGQREGEQGEGNGFHWTERILREARPMTTVRVDTAQRARLELQSCLNAGSVRRDRHVEATVALRPREAALVLDVVQVLVAELLHGRDDRTDRRVA